MVGQIGPAHTEAGCRSSTVSAVYWQTLTVGQDNGGWNIHSTAFTGP
jgi:hypothetical protein